MWGLLRLLVQHVVIRVTNERSVVRVEEHLVRNLEGIKSIFVLIMKKELHLLLACPPSQGTRTQSKRASS